MQVGKPDAIVCFQCPEAVARQRFLERKLPGRPDVDEASFNKRHQEYETLNADVLDHAREIGCLIEVSRADRPRIYSSTGTDIPAPGRHLESGQRCVLPAPGGCLETS